MTLNRYRHYWQVGFRTGLYDRLSPEAYLASLKRCAEAVSLKPGEVVLDAGCGSGLLLPHLESALSSGALYLGLDRLPAGLEVVRGRAAALGVDHRVGLLCSDLAKPVPVQPQTVSACVAHFSVYTLPHREDRLRAWRSLFECLTPGGVLAAANPATGYDAKAIIQASLMQLTVHGRGRRYWTARCLLYPFTRMLGLRHIQRQLENGVWHAYTREDFQQELQEAGFKLERHEKVYAGSGWLMVARKA